MIAEIAVMEGLIIAGLIAAVASLCDDKRRNREMIASMQKLIDRHREQVPAEFYGGPLDGQTRSVCPSSDTCDMPTINPEFVAQWLSTIGEPALTKPVFGRLRYRRSLRYVYEPDDATQEPR